MSSTSLDTGDKQPSYDEILSQQIDKGIEELERRTDGILLSALSAGLDMGFGPLLMAGMLTLVSGVYGDPLTEILLANLYSVGFIFVVLGRSELFTEQTTLGVFPVLDGRAALSSLGRLWVLVYCGNIVGGAAFAGFVVLAIPANTVDPAAFVHLAETYTTQSAVALFTGAVLAGWLMGLVSWLVAAAQDTLGRVFFVWLITASIAFLHLPHCIAGTVEILMGMFAGPQITLIDYGQFLLLATVGNIIGGTVFVALLKYGHTVRRNE